MGGQIRTCDAHEKPFPQNIVDTAKTEMVRVYVERWFPNPKDAKKKVKATMFVGEQPEEGADFCLADFNQVLGQRIVPVGGKISWKIVTWEQETYQKKDGTEGQKNVKHVEDLA